jgi:DNA-binding NarL/FixJ family response regulator
MLSGMHESSILIAHEFPIVRHGLRQMLDTSSDRRVIGEAADGFEAVAMAWRMRPDLVIVSDTIPALNWRAVIHHIRLALRSRVLILAEWADREFERRAVISGASRLVGYSATEKEFLTAVNDVTHDGISLCSKVGGFLPSAFQQRPSPKHRCGGLTAREQEVLRLLGEGMSSKQVAATLRISVRTAESHRARMMHRIEARSMAELIRYGIRHGVVSL